VDGSTGRVEQADRAEGARKATLHDVADAAGVSRQTVSNVINAPERVKDSTRARVEAAIAELGYHPNRMARSLQAQSSRLIGYQVFEGGDRRWADFVLDRFLHAITRAAGARGQHILLFDPGEDQLAGHAELFHTRTVDGFVLAETGYDDPRMPYLTERGIPFVAFGRTGYDLPYSFVDVDGAAGTRAGTTFLIERGHRRIAFLGWPEGSLAGDQRALGYRQALQAAGIACDPAYDIRGVNDLSTGGQALGRLMELPEPPTAVVTASDLLAAGVLDGAKARGVAVPADLAVVGFDDSPVAPYLSPPLTTLRQPLEEVGERVVEVLASRISGAPPGPDGILLAPDLVVRDSA
jgi:DNA-binding LacI/PurR family transcriptional regulator